MHRITHFLAACLFLSPCLALAWGAEAHRLIAELAETQLSAPARAEADRLLRREPGATLASVSTWADEVRRLGTASMHYVNLPEDDCAYRRERDCPDGRCVVEAIKAQLSVLKSGAPDAERLAALKWVVHLVGDIHQPLHAGLVSDKGGNLLQVRAFGRGSNLHAVWDSQLVKRRSGGPAQLRQDAAVAARRTGPHTEPASWAAESCEVRRRASFYPGSRRIDDEYAKTWDAELVGRLSLASARLADALNEALGAR